MRDSAVSRRLQQASEQLQAAIVSARRRRQSLSEFDQQKSGVDSDGKWNVEPTAVLTTQDFESDETMSADEAQPMQLEDQQSSEQDEASIATSLASISSSHSPVDRDEEKTADAVQDKREKNNNGIAESDTRKALDWMQRDVEQRARENRRVRETLAIAIHNITDVIADCVDSEASQLLLHAAAVATGMESGVDNNAGVSGLLPDRVDDLVNQWEDALVSWREQCIVEKQELIESFALFEEECLARMQVGEASHRREQERLQYQTSMNQMLSEDCCSTLMRDLESSHNAIEGLQMQTEDLFSHLAAVVPTNAQDSVYNEVLARGADLQDNVLRRSGLDITGRASASKPPVSRYQIALVGQTQRAFETECRLRMLLEECQTRNTSSVVSGDTMQTYQQKLELLEGRMQDVLQQVACDHEQFEYEQAKWALERRQRREKYDEVLDASVKVLKVLIIREKLMKKHERAQQRSREEIQKERLQLGRQVTSLLCMTKELMQECAMVLLVLQQLAVLKTSSCQADNAPISWTLPAKPVQMKNMIKRLRKMEVALDRRDWVESAAIATKVRPYSISAASSRIKPSRKMAWKASIVFSLLNRRTSTMKIIGCVAKLLGLLLVTALPADVIARVGRSKNCTLTCQPGEVCVIETVNCIRTPCPPTESCVATSKAPENSPVCKMKCGEFQECQIYAPDGSEYCADVCVDGRCPKGTTCELQEVQCIKAPCPPVAVCNDTTTTQRK